jgi:hypothetical protein
MILVFKNLNYNFLEPFKVLTEPLVEPRKEFRLRELDTAFVAVLKDEILERPNTFPKPLIAIAQSVMSRDDFDEGQIDALSLEVIGGNHRREALSQLNKEGKLNTAYTIVQLYTGMCTANSIKFSFITPRKLFRFYIVNPLLTMSLDF